MQAYFCISFCQEDSLNFWVDIVSVVLQTENLMQKPLVKLLLKLIFRQSQEMSDLETPGSTIIIVFLFFPLNILWSLAIETIKSTAFIDQYIQVWRWGITLFETFLNLNAGASLIINQKRDLMEQIDNFIHCNLLGPMPMPIAFRIALRNWQLCIILF